MLGMLGSGGGKPPWGGVPEALGGKGGKGMPRPPGRTVQRYSGLADGELGEGYAGGGGCGRWSWDGPWEYVRGGIPGAPGAPGGGIPKGGGGTWPGCPRRTKLLVFDVCGMDIGEVRSTWETKWRRECAGRDHCGIGDGLALCGVGGRDGVND
jgi:hypothetical protein